MYTYLTSKYTNIQIGDYFILRYDDLSVDYIASSKCIGVSGQTVTLILNDFSIQDCINPSLYVNGDTQLCGELMVGNENDRLNYVSIDSNRRFFGVNTDERFINYSDMVYTTTTNRYTPKHNVYIKNDAYPVMVSERICEDAIGTDVSNNDYIKFGTYTAFTVKRKSNIYDYSTLASYADKLDEAFHKNKKNTTDTVTHMRYGPDISFELCDKDNKTVELGQLQLTLDGMDASGNLQCGFGVSVNDYDKGTSFGDIRRNIIYVDNSSTLFVKQINLGGKVLSTDKNGKLLMNNKIVQLFPVEDAVVFHLTSTDNYKRLFTNIDKYIELNPTVQIKVVLDSNGINLMTTNFVTDNTIETQIKSYLDKSVVFEVCENTMFNNNMTKDKFIEGSTFITFAIQRYVELCREGFIGIEQQ
jgi:hypothetical protein